MEAVSDLIRLGNVTLSLPVTQASIERTSSGLRYILNEFKHGLKEDIILAIMFQHCNTGPFACSVIQRAFKKFEQFSSQFVFSLVLFFYDDNIDIINGRLLSVDLISLLSS